MSIYLTSDTHFNHAKILEYQQNRKFSSVEEMNEALIRKWNNCVTPEDTIIHCGDFCLGPVEDVSKIIPRLNGRIILVRGNHDTDAKLKIYTEEYGIEIHDIYRLKFGNKLFLCTHYPMIVDNGESDKHIYNLHGHTHQKCMSSIYPRCYSVGVDVWNFEPINIEVINNAIDLNEVDIIWL